MISRQKTASVNAGSMADIAFLLLIFFLVSTTIETDQGIRRKLPPLITDITPVTIHKRNIFSIKINSNDEILVDDKKMDVGALRNKVIAFLDNGGGIGKDACGYCKGEKNPLSSEHPAKAIIALSHDREVRYETYIAVQNALVGAYASLRDREAQQLYGMKFDAMKRSLKSIGYNGDRALLKKQIINVRARFPEKISEVEVK